jgi:CubicO group peptidase (beta-lactamase class C family)
MYRFNYLMPLFLAILIFSGCRNEISNISAEPGTVTEMNFLSSDTAYVSINGLWRCTNETALRFPNGILEPLIMFIGNDPNNLSVKGCFLWDGRFYDEWHLADYYYNDSTLELILKDEDGSIYTAKADRNYKHIYGIVQGGDPGDPQDSLEFVREKILKPENLFYARRPSSDGSIQYIYQQPETVQDGLITASVFEYTNDTLAFIQLMKNVIRQKYGRLESLLILKDKKLIVEEYYYDHDHSTLHNIHSDTKSIISLLLGIALDQHPAATVDQSMFDFFPEYDSLKRLDNQEITLRHLLTMHSGLVEHEDLDEDAFENKLSYYLSMPTDSEPGSKFRYCGECSNILGSVIHSLTGKQPDIFGKEVLFDPLGIKTYSWQTENGVPNSGSDLHMLPRDEIKIGLLVLNDGNWNGKQIVSEKWINESTKAHVKETKFYNYGYHWWNRSNTNVPWWRETEELIESELEKVIALGYGGQYIIIIRDLSMVVVTTASDYADGHRARSKLAMVVDEIEPMFRN